MDCGKIIPEILWRNMYQIATTTVKHRLIRTPFQLGKHPYLTKSFKQRTGCFCDDLTLQMITWRFKRMRGHLLINNQEVSVSEHKAKISQKNSGCLGQWANI